MAEPFPTTDAGDPDYSEAATQMDFDTASRVNPTFISDDMGSVVAIVGCDTGAGTVTVADDLLLLNTVTWTVGLEDLWDDWMHGSLTYRRREFLAPEEDVADRADECIVPRRVLVEAEAVARSELEDMERHADEGPWTDRVRDLIADLEAVLDDE
jgi:hypothetical protein